MKKYKTYDILCEDNKQDNNSVPCNATSAKTLFEKSKEFLEIFVEALKKAPAADIDRMSKQYGSGGPEKVEREFQRWINLKNPKFNPVGLAEYIKDSSGCYNEDVHKMLLEFLEKSRAYIFDTLKNESPEDWWDEKIPTKIKKSCAFAQIEDNYNHEPSYYLDKFQDLSEIVENNWKSLGGDLCGSQWGQ